MYINILYVLHICFYFTFNCIKNIWAGWSSYLCINVKRERWALPLTIAAVAAAADCRVAKKLEAQQRMNWNSLAVLEIQYRHFFQFYVLFVCPFVLYSILPHKHPEQSMVRRQGVEVELYTSTAKETYKYKATQLKSKATIRILIIVANSLILVWSSDSTDGEWIQHAKSLSIFGISRQHTLMSFLL